MYVVYVLLMVEYTLYIKRRPDDEDLQVVFPYMLHWYNIYLCDNFSHLWLNTKLLLLRSLQFHFNNRLLSCQVTKH